MGKNILTGWAGGKENDLCERIRGAAGQTSLLWGVGM